MNLTIIVTRHFGRTIAENYRATSPAFPKIMGIGGTTVEALGRLVMLIASTVGSPIAIEYDEMKHTPEKGGAA